MKLHGLVCCLELPALFASISSCIEVLSPLAASLAPIFPHSPIELGQDCRWRLGLPLLPWCLWIYWDEFCLLWMKQFVSFAIQISWHSNLRAALLSDIKMQSFGMMPRLGRYYRKVCGSLQIIFWLAHSWIIVKSKFCITTSEIWWHSNEF